MNRLGALRRFLDAEVPDWLQNWLPEGLAWIFWLLMLAVAAALLLAVLNGL